MRSALSFSLFGDDPTYSEGLMENLRLAPSVYPGWDVVAHVEQDHASIDSLLDMKCRVIEHPKEEGLRGAFWRFETLDWSDNYDVVCVRDADSRLNFRERAAVDEWLASDKTLHCMRDHKAHRRPIIGCGFGVRTGRFDFRGAMFRWKKTGKYGDDELFLRDTAWAALRGDSVLHSRYPQGPEVPFPPLAPGTSFDGGFVGAKSVKLTSVSAERLIPGISKYPELVERLRKRLGDAGCGGCNDNPVIEDFKKIVQRRQKRDKWARRR